MSTPKISAPTLKRGKKAAAAPPAEPARGRSSSPKRSSSGRSSSPKRSSSGRSSSPKRSPSGRRKSRYEEEYEGEEEYANWAMMMSPAAYDAVAARVAPTVAKASKYEEEEFEGEEEFEALQQKYTPADFSSVTTPLNLSIVLLVLLFILLILARR